MFTHFFIARPVLSSVISILIALGGLVAMWFLPIAQYPELAPPEVTVEARYPGATAEVIANTVAAPLETQINGVDNLLYFNSVSSSSGNVSISVRFKPGTDPDINQVNVQNRVSQATPMIPQVVTQQGVTVEKRSSSILMVLSIFSTDDRYDATYIDNYSNLYVLEELKRIPGANRATVFGLPDIAMRVWLQPDRMAQLGISVNEVSAAIQEQNQTFGVGQLGAEPMRPGVPQSFVVTAQGLLTKPEEFEKIIVRTAREGAAIVRVSDVARVELAKRDYSVASQMNGKTATTIGIYQQPGANALETSRLVREQLEIMKAKFPSGLDYRIAYDTSLFTTNSIEKVEHTFFEAVVLVILVVFLFLQSLRATIIPIIAVPVSILGTFIGMYALGFSINMLTLFGLILAIGLVVDDAIVVVENVEANMTRHGLSAREATKRAMTEISGALVSIVLVLVAVFLPMAFLGGVTGTLYKQFAVTIAIAVVLSGVTALTLSPALAAILIKPHHGEKRGFFGWFEKRVTWVTERYVGLVTGVLGRWPISLLVYAAIIVAAVALFRVLPGSFVPDEDQGAMLVVLEAPDTASQQYVSEAMEQARKILADEPTVQDIAMVNGFSILDGQLRNNAGVLFVSMKPFKERTQASDLVFSVLPRLNQKFAQIKGAVVFGINPPAIPGLGGVGGLEFYVQNRGTGDSHATSQAVEQFIKALRSRPELANINTTFRGSNQQLFVDLDRAKAEVLGVSVQDAFQTMQSFFGSAVAGQFSQFSRVWWVMLQADENYRINPEDFSKVFVRSNTGAMVPLSTLITVRYIAAPKLLERFNGFPAAKINAGPAPGYSSGQAIATMEAVARETLPADFSYAWAGQALQEKQAGGTAAVAFIAGLVVVFLLLAGQFEKWTLPLAVVLTVPVAILGALVLTWLLGLENDVYFQVGLVTLVGLSAKNAILICEVAIERVHAGMAVKQAAIESAGARLRAIVMTSLAFGLSCVPLATATGAGANSLRSIGTGVLGGVVASTVVGILFTPLFFWVLESMSQRVAARKEPEGGSEGAGGGSAGAVPQAKREDY